MDIRQLLNVSLHGIFAVNTVNVLGDFMNTIGEVHAIYEKDFPMKSLSGIRAHVLYEIAVMGKLKVLFKSELVQAPVHQIKLRCKIKVQSNYHNSKSRRAIKEIRRNSLK
ncbi:unnamed protein product [Macrosiphum euphorbiae]|uniref:Uncharacterized protein n=1 Tax=Macrosiphum euphorbiae TaxID=13131 RepID=A0AAV0W2K9_9HEMI|nr:unnamed protein product [Macrosiphum euphorbiae]